MSKVLISSIERQISELTEDLRIAKLFPTSVLITNVIRIKGSYPLINVENKDVSEVLAILPPLPITMERTSIDVSEDPAYLGDDLRIHPVFLSSSNLLGNIRWYAKVDDMIVQIRMSGCYATPYDYVPKMFESDIVFVKELPEPEFHGQEQPLEHIELALNDIRAAYKLTAMQLNVFNKVKEKVLQGHAFTYMDFPSKETGKCLSKVFGSVQLDYFGPTNYGFWTIFDDKAADSLIQLSNTYDLLVAEAGYSPRIPFDQLKKKESDAYLNQAKEALVLFSARYLCGSLKSSLTNSGPWINSTLSAVATNAIKGKYRVKCQVSGTRPNHGAPSGLLTLNVNLSIGRWHLLMVGLNYSEKISEDGFDIRLPPPLVEIVGE